MASRNEELKKKLSRIVLNSATPYLPGWIQTLGEVGSPESTASPQAKASAAKLGVDLVAKFMDGDIGQAGAELLAQLAEIESQAPSVVSEEEEDDD